MTEDFPSRPLSKPTRPSEVKKQRTTKKEEQKKKRPSLTTLLQNRADGDNASLNKVKSNEMKYSERETTCLSFCRDRNSVTVTRRMFLIFFFFFFFLHNSEASAFCFHYFNDDESKIWMKIAMRSV